MASGSNLLFLLNGTSEVRATDHGGPGGDDNLEVVVAKFTPNVVCSGSVSGGSELVESCQRIVDSMNAGRKDLTIISMAVRRPVFPEMGLPYIWKAPIQDSRNLESVTIL